MTSPAQEIAILFADSDISNLFHLLLSARGAQARIVRNTSEINKYEKLITEPQFTQSLEVETKNRCLVVGNEDSECTLDTLFISRPLTEAKIETALEKLFRQN